MYCPKCGTENPVSNRVCGSCGENLASVELVAPDDRRSVPLGLGTVAVAVPGEELRAFAITAAGILCVLGGALTIIGWILPWFGLGGLAGLVAQLLGLGLPGGVSRFIGNLFSGSGSTINPSIGNGIQVALGGLLAGFTLLFSGEGASVVGLLVLAADIAFINIPFLAVACIRHGLTLVTKSEPAAATWAKRYAASVLTILVILFIAFAAIPLGLSLLGGGFYWTVLGAVMVYVGAYLANNRLEKV